MTKDQEIEMLKEKLARVEAERDAVRSEMRRQSERHDELLSTLELATNQRDVAKAQLAEAVGLLRELSGELCSAAVIAAHAASAKEIPVSTTLFAPMRKFTLKDAQCKAKTLESILTNECDRLNAFLARHAQAEQQK